jgi:hypothetical protein
VLASSIPAENGFEDFETVSTPVSDTAARGILVDVDTASDTFFFVFFFETEAKDLPQSIN